MNDIDNLKKWLTQQFDNITIGLIRQSASDLGIVFSLAQNMNDKTAADILSEATHFEVSGNMIAQLMTLAYGVGKGLIPPIEYELNQSIIIAKGVDIQH